MSVLYLAGDETLWNPSNRVSDMFHGQVRVASSVFGVEPGLSELIEDQVYVTLDEYQQFVGTVIVEYERSLHGLLRSMIVGFLVPAVVMLQRAGGVLPSLGEDQEAAWNRVTTEQTTLMPR